MAQTQPTLPPGIPSLEEWERQRASRGQRIRSRMWRERYVYLLLLPGVLYFILFKYVPMFGLVLAFKDYSPFRGIWDSPWVGMEHFRTIFSDGEVLQVIRNTRTVTEIGYRQMLANR